MTTVVGIQGNGFAVLGADSRISTIASDGFVSQIHTAKPGYSKIAKNGPYLIGTAGDVRAINLLTHVFSPPRPTPKTNLDKFMTSKFIPELRDCFEKAGYSSKDKDGEHAAQHSSTILVAVKGSIYLIDGDYSWIGEDTGMYAIGTGSQYAVGALTAMDLKRPISKRSAISAVKRSLEIAAHFDPHTGPPYVLEVQEFPTNSSEKT